MSAIKKQKTAVKTVQASRRKPTKSARAQWWHPALMQHKHSFRMLHHRHTSYPLLACLLLLTGIFCMAWTGWVNGESYNVTAVIPAAPLTAPATILSPQNNDTVNTTQITVSGSCPNGSYVKLFTNTVFSGVSLCQNAIWQVPTNLTVGENRLVAQSYNVTDQPGPTSGTTRVVYRPVSTPASSTASPAPQTSKPNTANNEPLLLGADFTYVGYYVGQLSSWSLTISGGVGPYAVRVDWGDGNSDLKSLATAGAFDLQHTYGQAGSYKNSYTIKVTAIDANGAVTTLQLLTIISPVGAGNSTGGGAVIGNTPPAYNSLFYGFFKVITPIYAVIFVALACFWFGQRREFALARQQAIRTHKRRPVR